MNCTYTASKRPISEKRPTQNGKGKHIPSKWTGKIKAGFAIHTTDKIDFKTKAINTDIQGHIIIFKGRIHQENINIINIYAPNIGAPKC